MHSKTNSRNICSSVSVHNIVQLMSQTTTYDCSAAQQHIEYSPVVSMDVSLFFWSSVLSFSIILWVQVYAVFLIFFECVIKFALSFYTHGVLIFCFCLLSKAFGGFFALYTVFACEREFKIFWCLRCYFYLIAINSWCTGRCQVNHRSILSFSKRLIFHTSWSTLWTIKNSAAARQWRR